MASSSDNALKVYKWTDQDVLTLCEMLNKFITKNGRTSPFKWVELKKEFEAIVQTKLTSFRVLKNKYNELRQHYNLWKALKHGETGLGWNESTGKLECSAEWWEKKIKENPSVRKISKKQPSLELQEAWNQLFADAVASGVDCVSPSMDLTTSETHHVNLEDDDTQMGGDDYGSSQYSKYSSRLEQLENQEQGFYTSLLNGESDDDGLSPNERGGSKKTQRGENISTKPMRMKRKGRESKGSALFKELINQHQSTQQRALQILESDSSSKVNPVNQVNQNTVNSAISVVNRMVDQGLMAEGDELWCFAMSVLEDPVKREFFIGMSSDDGRLAWLKYKQVVGN